eukprot:GILK01001253.1.p1 GENE.GILK01001253.1~~GILK01001253.1.p1  ORF type:complete len:362 (+),score=52.46 GILK01001253.1:52-1137(+)
MSCVPTRNTRVLLSQRPVGLPKASDFQVETVPIPELDDKQILVEVLYLSCDPAMRVWISGVRSYKEPVDIGTVMHAHGVGKVLKSTSKRFAPGDLVQGFLNWQQYAVVGEKGMMKLPQGLPTSAFLGVLGGTGLTAYFGLLDIGQPKEGETVVVSAAAGAVGSIVGQIAKIKGCRVVGIAGGEDKCAWLRELGFDATINYKKYEKDHAGFARELKKACPKGIDVYFDNVGDWQLDNVLKFVNERARVVMCGAISTYNDVTARERGIVNYPVCISRRVRMEGFIILDYKNRFQEGVMQLGQWLQSGQLKHKEDITDGIENAPKALVKLFSGANTGKVLIRVQHGTENSGTAPSSSSSIQSRL